MKCVPVCSQYACVVYTCLCARMHAWVCVCMCEVHVYDTSWVCDMSAGEMCVCGVCRCFHPLWCYRKKVPGTWEALTYFWYDDYFSSVMLHTSIKEYTQTI